MAEDTVEKGLSPWWRRGALAVMVVGFTLLITMTVMTYKKAPPIPARVVDESGQVLFTGEDIGAGQEVFFKYGLMEHGTLWGHGAYLGPDYSASYLHREAEITRDTLASRRFGKEMVQLSEDERAAVLSDLKKALKTNRYDEAAQTLTYSQGEAASFMVQQGEWADYFEKGAPGQPAHFIKHPEELRSLTAYLVTC